MALNLGWTKEELGEMFLHLVFYAGLPSTLNALSVAEDSFRGAWSYGRRSR